MHSRDRFPRALPSSTCALNVMRGTRKLTAPPPSFLPLRSRCGSCPCDGNDNSRSHLCRATTARPSDVTRGDAEKSYAEDDGLRFFAKAKPGCGTLRGGDARAAGERECGTGAGRNACAGGGRCGMDARRDARAGSGAERERRRGRKGEGRGRLVVRPLPSAAGYATVITTLSQRSRTVSSPSVPALSYVVCVPGAWLAALCTVHVYCLPERSSAKLETL